MGTSAFNGSGSRFNSRFVQGEEIYAKQLNDLAAGVQASLPMPYLGDGPSVSYMPGGSTITYYPSNPVNATSPWDVTVNPDNTAYVYPGTVNNVVPSIGGVTLDSIPPPKLPLNYSGGDAGYSYIYIKCPSSGSTYPNSPVEIMSSAGQLTATNTEGYLLLTTLYKDTSGANVWRYVYSSLWTDRIKVGSADAKYYFGAV